MKLTRHCYGISLRILNINSYFLVPKVLLFCFEFLDCPFSNKPAKFPIHERTGLEMKTLSEKAQGIKNIHRLMQYNFIKRKT